MLLNLEHCKVRESGMVLLTLQVFQGHKGMKRSEERKRQRQGQGMGGSAGWVRATVTALSVSVLNIMACASLNTAATGN